MPSANVFETKKPQNADSSANVRAIHGTYTIGEPFIPSRHVCGFYPPDFIGSCLGLGDGPKRLYERLVRFAGRNGECFPSQKTLAKDMGKSERQIRYDLKKLVEFGFIRYQRGNVRKANRYEFLFHPLFLNRAASTEEVAATSGNRLPYAKESTAADCPTEKQLIAAVTGNELPPNINTSNLSTTNINTSTQKDRTSKKKPVDDERFNQLHTFISGLRYHISWFEGQFVGPGLIENIMTTLKDLPLDGRDGFISWLMKKFQDFRAHGNPPRSLGILKTLACQYAEGMKSRTPNSEPEQPKERRDTALEYCARALWDLTGRRRDPMPCLYTKGTFQDMVTRIANSIEELEDMKLFIAHLDQLLGTPEAKGWKFKEVEEEAHRFAKEVIRRRPLELPF